MQEAAAPAGPHGRTILVPRPESAQVGDPEVSVLRTGGAAFHAAPPAPRAATERAQGLPMFADSERGRKAFRPCGPAGTTANSTWHSGPVSTSANDFFRAVVVLYLSLLAVGSSRFVLLAVAALAGLLWVMGASLLLSWTRCRSRGSLWSFSLAIRGSPGSRGALRGCFELSGGSSSGFSWLELGPQAELGAQGDCIDGQRCHTLRHRYLH
eukprot:15442432-Alexandrium_andersonii.AAC.2